MPYEITNEPEYLFVRFSGVVTAEELDRFAEDAESAEDAEPDSKDRITDLTPVDRFEIGYTAVSKLATRRKLRRFTRPVKSAIVTYHDDQYGLARMFQMLNDHPQIDIRILYTVEEARDWLAFKSV